MTNSSATDLVCQYVDQVLNCRRGDVINDLFAQNYRDHHPLRVPGVLTPLGNTGSIRDIEAIVRFLRFPEVDFSFSLEDLLPGQDRVAYRLFGQGTIQLAEDAGSSSVVLQSVTSATQRSSKAEVRELSIPRTGLSMRQSGWPLGKIVSDRVVVTYSCVGIFKMKYARLTDRWGPEIME